MVSMVMTSMEDDAGVAVEDGTVSTHVGAVRANPEGGRRGLCCCAVRMVGGCCYAASAGERAPWRGSRPAMKGRPSPAGAT